jgi:hypothetical protein
VLSSSALYFRFHQLTFNSYERQRKKLSYISIRTQIQSQDIMVGDLIYLEDNEEAPCDMIILKTSDETGICYVQVNIHFSLVVHILFFLSFFPFNFSSIRPSVHLSIHTLNPSLTFTPYYLLLSKRKTTLFTVESLFRQQIWTVRQI